MSRCFPYPPPGYALSRASNDALIEPIKFQNGRVKSKEQKKSKEQREEKRREKKEKLKEKKDKTKRNPDKSRLVQSQVSEKFWADPKGEFLFKGSKVEPGQQLERSSVTEEHGKPVCLRAPSTSSDSTENSNKRKRQSSPIDVSRGHGKIIRIRLPLKKPNQSDASVHEQQICSTSGRTNIPSQNEDVIGNRNDREQFCSTSQPIETFVAKKTPNPSMTNAVMTPMRRAELQYTDLMDSLVPPQRQDASHDTDLYWLLKSNNRESCAGKKRISGNDSLSSCSSSSGLCPRAQYLQEVDVYALPFTVPF